MKYDKRMKFPCKQCIVLAVCKSYMMHSYNPPVSKDRLMSKCSLLKEYIYSAKEIPIPKLYMATRDRFVIVKNDHVQKFYSFMNILLADKEGL